MKCPIDGSELRITDRQGIEIDYCPQCRGVWLDRGELDKILERSAQPGYRSERDARDDRADRSRRDDDYRPRSDDDYRPRSDDDYRPRDSKKSRRRSFLEDLLDFD